MKSYDGLTIDFCKEIDANFILRGIRNNGDFEFEKAIARTNRKLSKIETVFLLTSAKTSFISSSIVRDLIKNNLKLYKNSNHPHESQNPKTIDFKSQNRKNLINV